jgi:hypothetical protein
MFKCRRCYSSGISLNNDRHHMFGLNFELWMTIPLLIHLSWNQRVRNKPITSRVKITPTNDISPHKRTYGIGLLMEGIEAVRSSWSSGRHMFRILFLATESKPWYLASSLKKIEKDFRLHCWRYVRVVQWLKSTKTVNVTLNISMDIFVSRI